MRKGDRPDKRMGRRSSFPASATAAVCFPKDVKALGYTAQEHGYDFKIYGHERRERRQKRVLVKKAHAHFRR